jgi:AraC-like DNA-binding protein
MNPQDEALVAERLGQLMDGQKAYLKENLSLDDVASAVRCSPHWISQHINGTLKLSFFDYINGLRVEEFLRLARNPEMADRTIFDLALQAGFRSKSTFNLAFRKKMGTTPGQWKNSAG